MKLLINDDNGRLTEAPSLARVFDMLDLDRDREAAVWLDCLSQVTEPFVLFLHCEAKTAFDRLEMFMKQGTWPMHLKGVVVFNSTRFAGLTQSERVRHEMAIRGLAVAPIHVVRTAIHDHRSEEIVNRIRQFADALLSGRAFASSTWLLEPPDGLDAAVALWALGMLVTSNHRMASGNLVKSYVLENIDTEALRELAANLQVALSVDVEASLRNMMSAFAGRHSDWASELPCRDCSVRQKLRHGFQKSSSASERAYQDIAEVLSLYEARPNAHDHRAKQIALALPVYDATILVPFLQECLDRLYGKSCHFEGDRATRRALEIRDIASNLDSGLDQIATDLVAALRCEFYDLAMSGTGNQISSFDPWRRDVEAEPRRPM